MPEEKIIILEDIGEIKLRKNTRFKRLSVRMAPTKGVWINVPYSISYKEALNFAITNKAWILKNRVKLRQKESKQTIFTENTVFKTHFHQLRLSAKPITCFKAKLGDGYLEVKYPLNSDITNDSLQKFVRKSIVETILREAKYYLPKRTEELAKKYGFTYTSTHIKNTKSRWGSCTHDNKINLCIHLMRIPEELCDMVILHELCHTKIKNHSKEFYELLAKVCTSLEEKRREIKNYSISIF